jgi:hypothetical protein
VKGKGLMLVLGGGPKKAAPRMGADEGEEKESGGAGDTLAGEAFDALQEGDREGFVAAFKSAVRACAGKADAGGYEDEDDSEDF